MTFSGVGSDCCWFERPATFALPIAWARLGKGDPAKLPSSSLDIALAYLWSLAGEYSFSLSNCSCSFASSSSGSSLSSALASDPYSYSDSSLSSPSLDPFWLVATVLSLLPLLLSVAFGTPVAEIRLYMLRFDGELSSGIFATPAGLNGARFIGMPLLGLTVFLLDAFPYEFIEE